MYNLSIGKLRGLQEISTGEGVFVMCAMDHRDSLRNMISPKAAERVKYGEIVERKLELCGVLAPHASAVLLDPNYGVSQCISANVLPGDTGLLVSIESTGYSGSRLARITTLLEDWNVAKIKKLGASAVKILIYYRPDLRRIAGRQLTTVKKVAKECVKHDIPFLVETKSYPIIADGPGIEGYAAKKPDLVINTARQVTDLPVDVLKIEFPADMRTEKDEGRMLQYCLELNAASRLPWVILSGGVDFDIFLKQVEIACKGGASGFLGGSAIWQEAMKLPDKAARVNSLQATAVDRLKKLADVTARLATPWYKKLGLSAGNLTDVVEDWYRTY